MSWTCSCGGCGGRCHPRWRDMQQWWMSETRSEIVRGSSLIRHRADSHGARLLGTCHASKR
eukprot:3472852-Rhodomonas_salina.2